ncbi:hypothetical protein ITJ66_16710 [Plantibacter sp. VKM Ac-2885]|uniref:hypothetical protein n=1 Tax=Plantibacter sp. VKM Ac-2885 TaxID=2783828 RepID=UPI00188AE1C1|nr:hypothetical protein [Plantibacter sp. VKM Ac-2885]MBF4514129.1 hypothetical protein [Plantibacter sp. VKM Ac-2885]
MNDAPDYDEDLRVARDLKRYVQVHHRLPRWYVGTSTLLFLVGVWFSVLGVVAGWFLPLVGAALLTMNVLLFVMLLVIWRKRGVVPLSGQKIMRRYWRIAPIVVPAALVLGAAALALHPAQRIWVCLAVVVPFAFEHIHRLRSWTRP